MTRRPSRVIVTRSPLRSVRECEVCLLVEVALAALVVAAVRTEQHQFAEVLLRCRERRIHVRLDSWGTRQGRLAAVAEQQHELLTVRELAAGERGDRTRIEG